MPEIAEIVINTSPIVALVAATGDLRVLRRYRRVCVPLEVCHEIAAGGAGQFALAEFQQANWLSKSTTPIVPSTMLGNTLDLGEASVIQLALERNIQTVCIDESVGRRIARLSGLQVTGSLGILLKAKREGYPIRIAEAIVRMRQHGIWLSERVVVEALYLAGEDPIQPHSS